MFEATRPTHQETFPSGPGTQDDLFDNCGVGGLVTVNHGLHTERLPVGNMTVGEIRARYADRFDIDPQSQGHIDGHAVSDDAVCRPGQMLMFVHHAGIKGANA